VAAIDAVPASAGWGADRAGLRRPRGSRCGTSGAGAAPGGRGRTAGRPETRRACPC
jgi:hypothetical protein